MLKGFTNKIIQIRGSMLHVPIMGNPAFDLSSSINVGDIRDKMLSSVENVNFRHIDGIQISKQTPASELLKLMFIIEIEGTTFKVFPPVR
jgi:hypothetical protein